MMSWRLRHQDISGCESAGPASKGASETKVLSGESSWAARDGFFTVMTGGQQGQFGLKLAQGSDNIEA